MSTGKKLQIRNSTAEFLIFTRQAGEAGIEVRVAEETVWLTQKLMATLFEVTVPTVNEHLANLYAQKEIVEAATLRNFRTVQTAGRREVARNVDFYNLDAIIAVGFRVNSARAIQFLQWASGVEWLGQVPELRANGPALIQPRATPWVRVIASTSSPERAEQTCAGGSPFQRWMCWLAGTQGVALVWHGTRLWRCEGGAP